MKYFQIKIDNKIFSNLIPNENYNHTAKSGINSAFYGTHCSSEFLINYQQEEHWIDHRTCSGYLKNIIEIIAWDKNIKINKIEIDLKEVR